MKMDQKQLETIIHKTLDMMKNTKSEVTEIAMAAKSEIRRLEEELKMLKEQVEIVIRDVEHIEKEMVSSRKRLVHVNSRHDVFDEKSFREAYEKADNLRLELAVKREQEHAMIRRRNDLEVRFKEALRMVERAENLVANLEMAFSYIGSELMGVSAHLAGAEQKRLYGNMVIRAQEEERQRVAREIHDGPAQAMSHAVVSADICERLMENDPEEARKAVKGLREVVRNALADVRRIIYNLRPMSLDDLGLLPTIQRVMNDFTEMTGVQAAIRTRGKFEDLSQDISLTVFRLVQEALANIRKYAQAKAVVISLECTSEALNLLVVDDGVGFDTEKTHPREDGSGFGIVSMKERADLMGGTFEIRSQPGQGTRISVRLPLAEPQEQRK